MLPTTERVYLNMLLLVLGATQIAFISIAKFQNPVLNMVYVVSIVTLLLLSAKIVSISNRLNRRR